MKSESNISLQTRQELIRKLKIDYYLAMVIMAYCFLFMSIGVMYKDGFFWQFMMIPIAIQAPIFYLSRKILLKNKEI